MALNTRSIPVGATGGTTTGWAGPGDIGGITGRRYYSCNVGSTVDVPGTPDGDAGMLTSQGFAIVALSGPTSSRPTSTGLIRAGLLYIDTSLNGGAGAVIVWDGLVWRRPDWRRGVNSNGRQTPRVPKAQRRAR
jgi:hypothetical protein